MATKMTLPSISLTLRPLSLPVSSRKRRSLGKLVTARASGEGKGRDCSDGEGKIVDENMIVLRMRIHDVKMSENVIGEDHSEWMEWERRYLVYYKEDVLEGIGLLQNYLMNVRPCLAFACMALLASSVMISSGFVVFCVMEITKHVISRFPFTLT